jgi:hypothetical protein
MVQAQIENPRQHELGVIGRARIANPRQLGRQQHMRG